MDVAIVTVNFHRGSPQIVVSGEPYFDNDGTTRRVEIEVLGPRDDVRHGLRYRWNRKVDEVPSPNLGDLLWNLFICTLTKHTQIVGGCAAYTGWHWYRFILTRVKPGARSHWSGFR